MDREAAESFCRQWLPAWTGNQPDRLLACYAEDAVYRDPARPAGLHGREQLARYLRRLLAANPCWRWEAVEVVPTAAGFCLKWRAEIPIGERVLVEEGLDLVDVRDGLIVRNEVYFDRAGWMAALAQGTEPLR